MPSLSIRVLAQGSSFCAYFFFSRKELVMQMCCEHYFTNVSNVLGHSGDWRAVSSPDPGSIK